MSETVTLPRFPFSIKPTATGLFIIVVSAYLPISWWAVRQVLWFHKRSMVFSDGLIHGLTLAMSTLTFSGVVLGSIWILEGYDND